MRFSVPRLAPVLIAITLLLPSMLAIGQTVNSDNTNLFADSTWMLTIHGKVNNPLNLSLSEIPDFPSSQVNAALYCEGILISEGDWTGVQIRFLLEHVKADTAATNLEFHAQDGYAMNVSMIAAMEMTIAYELNGAPLAEGLRLVLPGYQGYYWISMITEIEVTDSTNYQIGPPPPPPPIITARPTPLYTPFPLPSPTQIASPPPTPEPVLTPTPSAWPAPSLSPSTTPSPSHLPTVISSPTEQPPSPEPTAEPYPTQDETPSVSPEPFPTHQPNNSPTPSIYTTSTPDSPSLDVQQENQSVVSLQELFMDNVLAVLLAAIAIAVIVVMFIYKRIRIG